MDALTSTGTDLALIVLSTALVNNVVMTQFLGLCPFVGVSARMDAAYGLSAATAAVLIVTAAVAYLVNTYILVPLDAPYLRTIAFIFAIATAVQTTELSLRALAPRVHRVLGVYLPLITTNCAVLGIALLSVERAEGFISVLVNAVGAAAGFGLVLVLFAGIRDRSEGPHIPSNLRGAPVTLISAALLSLAFMGFAGMGISH
jgi:electron transport complex protein RnfA